MHEMWAALATAARLIATLDRDLVEIVLLSLKVNFGSVALASLIGLPLGAALALFSFVGRRTAIVIVSALMGLPPVVVGLVVYLLLSRAGPFGVFGLNSPLKKASLTGFHATAKHIAAKAVSPSSETMRTI